MLIGLTGYAQHGKDTVAHKLVEDYAFNQYAFAAPLKELAYRIDILVPYLRTEETVLGIGQVRKDEVLEMVRLSTVVDEVGWDAAKKHPEVRRFLQELGTRCREVLGDNVWVDALAKQLVDDLYDGEAPSFQPLFEQNNVVVSDVRFPNEVEWVKAYGGQLWLIERVNEDGTPYDNGIGTEHASEQHIASFNEQADYVLVAAGVNELYLATDEGML